MSKCATMLTLLLIILKVQQETKPLHRPRLIKDVHTTYIYLYLKCNLGNFVIQNVHMEIMLGLKNHPVIISKNSWMFWALNKSSTKGVTKHKTKQFWLRCRISFPWSVKTIPTSFSFEQFSIEFVHKSGSFIAKRETHGILQRILNFYKVDKFSL